MADLNSIYSQIQSQHIAAAPAFHALFQGLGDLGGGNGGGGGGDGIVSTVAGWMTTISSFFDAGNTFCTILRLAAIGIGAVLAFVLIMMALGKGTQTLQKILPDQIFGWLLQNSSNDGIFKILGGYLGIIWIVDKVLIGWIIQEHLLRIESAGRCIW